MTPADVRRIRAALQFTQQQLADATGTTRNSVARWECGVRAVPPTAAILLRLLAKNQKKGRML